MRIPAFFLCSLLLPGVAFAQEVAVKSIPVATGSQFLLYPSAKTAMGNVSIALDDAWGDPFDNPAKGHKIPGAFFAATPHYYTIGAISEPDGHVTRTLPASVVARRGKYFGGIGVAWQEMVRRGGVQSVWIPEDATSSFVSLTTIEMGAITRNNLYATALGGVTLREGLSMGASVFIANLRGIEGVQLLYSQGDDVEQEGHMATYKVGLHQRWTSGRTAEIVVQHNRFKMSHSMLSMFWGGDWQMEERLEKDETNGVALRLGYTQPISRGWVMGARLVGDWKSHPKIPNYDLMQIPRDPGNTGAYNVGIGFSRVVGRTTYALDMIYEPIWSHTWANAEEDIIIDDEPTGIKAGDMTVENYFRFHNGLFRIGVQQQGRRLGVGLGLDLHMIRYRLEQENFVRRSQRALEESWGEWTLTGGLSYDFNGFLLQYVSIWTWGTGQPGLAQRGPAFAEDGRSLNSSFVVAPAGALDLIEARVWTHRLSLILPLSE